MGCEENDQESSHDTSSSTNMQEDGIIHMEHHADDENSANSNSLNTVTNGRKNKVSQKKKASIKPKGESSSSIALVEKNENKVVNSFKDDRSRREYDLKKLIDITRESVMHPIFSP
ncbi:hypothetical protein RhiirC2_795673 [Rhizophagus irregularis]|uniref:Uncharacterized protein n=1 Tax=Rhizophagus irregularis TaxID=588596 RepID=A0A2N1MB40_9GLOM|nr:hypothetical protein RhiirC2_795673 [Rhizophagus irregularis]